MASEQLISPTRPGDCSPTERRPLPQRRTALFRQQLSLDIPDHNRVLLSSSLPSPISKKELNYLKEIHHNEKNKRQKDCLSYSMEAEPGQSWF